MPPPCFRVVVERELGPRYTAAFDAVTVSARNGVPEITRPIIDASNLRRLPHGSPRRAADCAQLIHSNPTTWARGAAGQRSNDNGPGAHSRSHRAPVVKRGIDMTALLSAKSASATDREIATRSTVREGTARSRICRWRNGRRGARRRGRRCRAMRMGSGWRNQAVVIRLLHAPALGQQGLGHHRGHEAPRARRLRPDVRPNPRDAPAS